MVVNGNSSVGLTAKVQTLPPIKAAFELAKPYPNPCTSLVNFYYVLSGTGDGELSVFDISGRKVYETEVRNDSGTITWEIDGGYGKKVSNGVYFVKLSDGNETDIKKFVISR